MSIKAIALAALTVSGVGAVIALNPVDARSGSARDGRGAAATAAATPTASGSEQPADLRAATDTGAPDDFQPGAASSQHVPSQAIDPRRGERPFGPGAHHDRPRYVPPAGAPPAPGEDVNARHDFSEEWEHDGGWHGRWDDHVRRRPEPGRTQTATPREDDGESGER